MYFKTDNFFHIPNNDYVNVDAFNVLKYNTIALSDNIEVNSTYAYYVPVTFLHASYDNENGYQTIAKISSYGLTSYITLSCDLSLVPDKLFGFWKSKAEVYKSPTELDTSHDYFDFICIDPNVIKYL